MKWIELNKARKLQFNEPVFVKRPNEFAHGKLIKKEQSKDGLKFTFQIAAFDGGAFEADDITHIAIP